MTVDVTGTVIIIVLYIGIGALIATWIYTEENTSSAEHPLYYAYLFSLLLLWPLLVLIVVSAFGAHLISEFVKSLTAVPSGPSDTGSEEQEE